MPDHLYESLYRGFYTTFLGTIKQHGVKGLKETSLFGSNDRA